MTLITRFKQWWRKFVTKHIVAECPEDIDL